MGWTRKTKTGWRAVWRDPAGTTRSKTFRRREDAKAHLVTTEGSKIRGEYRDPHLARVTFETWAGQVQAGRVSGRASTRARDDSILGRHVLPRFGPVPIGRITTEDVSAWVAGMVEEGYASETVRKAYQLLAGILARAVATDRLVRSPCRNIELPRVEGRDMRFLSEAEVEDLTEAIVPRYRALVLAAAYTGARFGELAALRTDRLNVLGRSLRIEETVNEVRGRIVFTPGKTKAARRTVSIPAFLADVLAEHLTEYPAGPEGLVFTAPEGGPLRRNAFRVRQWLPAVRASVEQPCRFHDLRHSHAAMMIRQNVHPSVLKERLGHKSITTTLDRYGHLYDGLDQEAAATLDAARAEAVASTGSRAASVRLLAAR